MAENGGFIDPSAGGARVEIPLAARPKDLSGKVVGFLDNTKEQADIILQTIGDAFREQHDVARLVINRKEHYSKPAAEDLIKQMAGECDAVVCALGG